jgi:coproporphyrinogen III oxidase-like Fe-S oxidoreductase
MPRYTSYPLAPHWQTVHRGLLTSALRNSTIPLSIYVHIPFCERDGLIEGRTSRTIRITPSGRIFVRAVARLFDTFQFSAVASKAV